MKKLKVQTDLYFRDITTFKVGGKIKYYVEVKNEDEICEAVTFAKENNLEIFIAGGGSDILVSDKDFDGVVIKYSGKNLNFKRNVVTAEAGLEWDKLVDAVVKKGLQGIECLSGIPGSVGASPIQNIGAYGQELKDTFLSLTAYDIDKEKFVEFNKDDCHFGYRESIFKQKKYWQKFIITEIKLRLVKTARPAVKYESLIRYLEVNKTKTPTLKEVRDAVLYIRSQLFQDPKTVGNAGSFFKSPIVEKEKLEELKKKFPDIKFYESDGKYKLPAGWLIEKAGLKGRIYKEAGISSKHALILINRNNKATAKEIIELSEEIINKVFQKYGLKLEREVQLINF